MAALRALVALLVLCGCRIGFDPDPNSVTQCLAASRVVAPGDSVDGVLCRGNVDRYTITLAAGEEIEATIVANGPGWPALEIIGPADTRAVKTLNGVASAFADRDGEYVVRVSGVAAAMGTPYALAVKLRSGRHYFIAPDGNDVADGSFAQPWNRFAVAFARIGPGDVLVLHDGTYTVPGNGRMLVDCSAMALTGTAAAPIRIAALSERRALLQGDGNDVVTIRGGCAWWTLEGLRIENVDQTGFVSSQGVVIRDGASNITVRRLLVRHNNRAMNSHLIDVTGASDVLVEESELYDFHRAGVVSWEATRVTMRRNYAASRGRADITGGYTSDPAERGDSGIHIGLSYDALAENNVEEGNGVMVAAAGYDVDCTGARLFGNIARGNHYGFVGTIDDIGGGNNLRTQVRDHVSIDSEYFGFYFRSNQQASCERCTTLRSKLSGWVADQLPSQPRLASSTCTNCLAIGSPDFGFIVQEQTGGWRLERPHAFGNGTNFEPIAPELVDARQGDPQLGGCTAYVPASSPLYGTGIGAEVVYRYQDGVLTDVPLWDPETGAFPCGAVVPGINDDPSTSCRGVHERLHVGTADCPLPYPAL